MVVPPKRPERPPQPTTRPDLPAASQQSDHEGEPPAHHDSSSPPKWELDKALSTVRDALEKHETLLETVDELSTNLEKERKRAEDLEERLERFRRQSRDDDDARDRKIQTLAEQVAEINKPHTQADGAVGAATVINAARNREVLKQVAYFVGLVLLALAQLLGWRLPGRSEPTETVPDVRPKQAEPGVQH